jgi:uncharacterized protein (DUF488 family)
MSKLFTIGFTKKNARQFFTLLKQNNVEILADVRLNNSGQLAGFSKKDDLPFFLELFHISYEHWKDFAPLKQMRDEYRSSNNWNEYEEVYKKLIEERKAIEKLDKEKLLNKSIVLLCSEPTPHKCHRRIVAEQIQKYLPELEIVHL